MKSEISEAIIVRVKEFGESDLLVTFFTPHRGLLKGVAKSARRSRKRFMNCFDHFSLVSLEYALRREGGLCVLHSGRLVNGYPGLKASFSSLAKASFMIELIQVLFPFGVADSRAFELLKESLVALDSGESAALVPVFFEARALNLGGYKINLEECSICGRTYKGEGAAVFNSEKGRIACLKCERPSAVHPLMTPESVRTLGSLQEGTLSALQIPVMPHEMTKQLGTVLRLHREYRLEQRLKTSKYLG
jgi:DNA repair protein RecO (recombination protein O)